MNKFNINEVVSFLDVTTNSLTSEKIVKIELFEGNLLYTTEEGIVLLEKDIILPQPWR